MLENFGSNHHIKNTDPKIANKIGYITHLVNSGTTYQINSCIGGRSKSFRDRTQGAIHIIRTNLQDDLAIDILWFQDRFTKLGAGSVTHDNEWMVYIRFALTMRFFYSY